MGNAQSGELRLWCLAVLIVREKRIYADEKRQHVERLRNLDQALMSHENTAAFFEDSREVHPGDQHHNHKGVRIIKNSYILEYNLNFFTKIQAVEDQIRPV